MSDIVEIQRLRGNQADKDTSTRVPATGQLAVVLDEQYAVLGDGVTELQDLRPMEDRRIDTVNDTDGPLVMSDVSASIIAADTTDGDCEVDLPLLANNQGRKVYVINVGAANSIVINAQSGDGIGASGAATLTVDAQVTILVGLPAFWQQIISDIDGGDSATSF